jgi:hypothetical protein
MESFRATLNECGLGDLGFRGPKCTWRNKRASTDFLKEILDRTLANGRWCGRFPNFAVGVLVAWSSDHIPLWLSFCSPSAHLHRTSSFKFEASWNIDLECKEVVKLA